MAIITRKHIKKMKQIEKDFEEWKKKYNQKFIPKNMKEKDREKWLNEVYLANDNGVLKISGGGRILLWYAIINSNRNWKEHLSNLEKTKNYNNYFEVLKFIYRQKLFNIDLIKKVDIKKLLN